MSSGIGWHKISYSELSGSENTSPCPANGYGGYTPDPANYFSTCKAVVYAWSEAAPDTKRNRLIIWGGGHSDYAGNELYALDLSLIGTCSSSSPCIYRMTNPSPPAGSGCTDPLGDGRPASRHTYGSPVYDPIHDLVYYLGGGFLNFTACGSNITWELDPTSVNAGCAPACTSSWTQAATTNPFSNHGLQAETQTDWNPWDGNLWMMDQYNLGYFNPNSNTWTAISNGFNSSSYLASGAIDPVDQYMVVTGNTTLNYYSIAPGSSFSEQTPSLTGCGSNVAYTQAYPGFQWDPFQREFIYMPNTGLNSVYHLNPKNWRCWSETYGSTKGTDYPQDQSANGTSDGSGTGKRFGCFWSLDTCVVLNDFASDAWYLNLREGDPKITNSTGGTLTNQPITISQPFVQGRIPNCALPYIDGTVVAAYQNDVKNRWPDGSLKLSVVSFIIPSLANGAQIDVVYDNTTTCDTAGASETVANMLANYNFDGQIQLTGTASHNISARTILTAANAGSGCATPTTDIEGTLATSGNLCVYWLKGPIVTAVILEDRSGRSYDVNTDGGMGNPLHPIFEVWFYPQTHQVQLGYTLEDDWASTTGTSSARDETYSLILTGGNSSPATEFTNGSFAMLTRTRWHKTFCINGTGAGSANSCTPNLVVDHDWGYWASTKFFPNYDPNLTIASSLISAYTNTYAHSTVLQGDASSSGGIANFDYALDATGAAAWHGPESTWDIVYLMSQDHGVLTEMLTNADLGGRLPYFYREADASAGHGQFFDAPTNTVATQGRIVSINARTQVSLDDVTSQTCATNYAPDWINFGTGGQDVGNWGSNTDTTHWPNLAYASYITTGQYAYYEEQMMQSAYAIADSFGGTRACVQSGGGSYRQGAAGYWWKDQERGEDWIARENAIGAFIAIDGSPEKAYFLDKLNTNLATWEGSRNITLDISGCVAVTCSAAWTFGNTLRTDSLGTGTALGSWTQGQSAYPAGAPLNTTGPNVPALANANFQNAYSAVMIGWINQYGLCPNSCAMLNYTANWFINSMNSPAVSYDLAQYIYPTQDQNGLQTGINTWTKEQTFYASHLSAWPACNTITMDESYGHEGMAAISFMTGITSSQGGNSGQTAWNNIRSAIGCINTSAGFDFASSSPKWDIVPCNTNCNLVPGTSPQSPTLRPPTVAWGNQYIGIPANGSQTVTLTNNDPSLSLSVSSLTFSGANTTDFSEIDNCIGSVPPLATCNIAISFFPLGLGSRTCSLVETDNSSGSPQSVSLSGFAVQGPQIGVF